MKTDYKPGDIVRIIRQPQDNRRVISTVTGLYGFVVFVHSDKKSCYVDAFTELGKDRSSGDSVGFEDIRPCRHPKWVKFLKPLAQAELARKGSPVVAAIVRDATSPARMEKEARDKAEQDTWAAANPNPFFPNRGIARDDKGDYLAYSSKQVRDVEYMRRGFVGQQDRSAERAVTWRRANAFLDTASFWSDREIIRNLVRELDLDPYVNRFNLALYRISKHPRVTTAGLRKAVIRLLNAGHTILDLTPVNHEDSCREDGEFWLITTGKRKKLPVA